MYVGRTKPGLGRMARAHRLSGVRGLRGRLGQDSIDWGSIIQTGIQTAGAVSAIAFKPPTYSSVINPYTGAQSITSYGAVPNTGLGLGAGTSLSSLLTSPVVLFGGLALLAVFALKR